MALLLDEPLTGLDPAGMRRMKSTIAARARAGAAVVLSSHLLHLVEELCTKLLVMRKGKCVAYGTLAQIVGERPDLAGQRQRLIQPPHEGHRKLGYVLMALGVFFQLQSFGLTHMRSAWPFVLVVIGGFLVWRALGRSAGPPTAESSSQLSEFAIMGGVHRVVESSDFRGGEATAIMGAVELDLRGSTIATSPAVIDVFALWGGIEIMVPPEWKVDVKAMPILGAFENKARSSVRDSSAPTQELVIRGTALMGGVEIKN